MRVMREREAPSVLLVETTIGLAQKNENVARRQNLQSALARWENEGGATPRRQQAMVLVLMEGLGH